MAYAGAIIEEAEQKWRLALNLRPELDPAIKIQRRVTNRILALAKIIDEKLPVQTNFEIPSLVNKLVGGTPILAGEWLEVDSSSLSTFAMGFCEDLAQGEAGAPAERLRLILDEGRVEIGSLVSTSLGRGQKEIRTKANFLGIAPDLLWLVAELVAGPIANRIQRKLIVETKQPSPLLLAIQEWNNGFCQFCGSWPAFSEQVKGTTPGRTLRCSYCGGTWTLKDDQCIYCRDDSDSLISAAINPDQPSEKVELCQKCGVYLKCIEVSQPTSFELLAVEDLVTTELDIGAAEQGYTRAPMPIFESPKPPCLP